MKLLLIVNPKSGDRHYQKKLATVQTSFKRYGFQFETVFSEYQGHAEKIARDACQSDYDIIVAAGGDGTINEVIQGMAGCGKKLGILPWGTGNVFAAEMNFPRSVRSLCKMIRHGYSLRLDLGKANGRYFLLMFGGGFDAYTIKQMAEINLKRFFGVFAYALSALRAFTRYKNPEITIKLPDGTTEKGSFVLISNTSRYAAFFTITPRAVPLDGMLDVFLFQENGHFNLLMLALQVFQTAIHPTWLKKNKIFFQRHKVFRTDKLELLSENIVYTQADGELAGQLPVHVEVVPKAIDIIMPHKTIRRMRKLNRRYYARLSNPEPPLEKS